MNGRHNVTLGQNRFTKKEERGKMVKVNSKECTGCESCVESCPVEAISMVEGVAVIDQEKCTECGTCIGECPVEAITEE